MEGIRGWFCFRIGMFFAMVELAGKQELRTSLTGPTRTAQLPSAALHFYFADVLRRIITAGLLGLGELTPRSPDQ